MKIYDGLVIAAVAPDADPAVDNVYIATKRALDNHFNPQRNTEFEKYTFKTSKQQQGETIDAYHARLRSLAKYCDFSSVDSEIKSHIIQTCTSSRLRRRGLTNKDITLQELVDLARSMEIAERQVRSIEQRSDADIPVGSPTVAAIQSTTVNHRNTTNQPGMSFQTCNNCQKRFPHAGGRMSCPAWGKTCHQCGKPNHFANSCRSAPAITQNSAQQSKNPGNRPHRKSDIQYRPPSQTYTQHQTRRVRQIRDDVIDEPDDSDTDDVDGQIYTIGKRPRTKQPRVKLTVNNTKMAFMIDSGASVNIMDQYSFSQLNPSVKSQI